MQTKTITGYRFSPPDLNVANRPFGISAYLRTRNGADFVEATIRSHIETYDEIVAVYNQCEDDTGEILARLAQEFSPKIRVFHYTDRVQPLGSQGHATTAANAPESMVNYSNFALSQTRFRVVVKLDDDHLSIPGRVGEICASFRQRRADLHALHCFSGLNIARDSQGKLGIPAFEPVSGGGDIGYFAIDHNTYFFHDRRFERFGRGRLKRVFAGYFYWHLKYLKTGEGFRNYELADNPNSRFGRKKSQFRQSDLLTLPEAVRAISPSGIKRRAAALGGKFALNHARNMAAAPAFPDPSLADALDRLSPGWRKIAGLDERHD